RVFRYLRRVTRPCLCPDRRPPGERPLVRLHAGAGRRRASYGGAIDKRRGFMTIKVKPKSFQYEVRVRWGDLKRGVLTAAGKPDLEVASPPEFRGHPGVWTPEHLFVEIGRAHV